jgi:cytochrome c oxidase subunit II
VRRLAPLVLLALLLVGCSDSVPGGKKLTTPTPDTVIGQAPKPPQAVKGNAAAGKAAFTSAGCGACHTFTPAGTKATIGPDLDKLAANAQTANQGSLADYTKTSIVDPAAYVVPGFKPGIMPPTYGTSLKPAQLADIVAFLTQGH